MPNAISQSVLSTQMIQVQVTVWSPSAYDPTSDTVQFAFTTLGYPVTEPSVWVTGSWVTFPGRRTGRSASSGPRTGGPR